MSSQLSSRVQGQHRRPRSASLRYIVGASIASLAGGYHGVDPVPTAVFCAYDCSAASGGEPPNWPGRCLKSETLYRSNHSWLRMGTRTWTSKMSWGTHPLVEPWMDLIAGDMTWEAWIRVLEPPPSPSMLIGTMGYYHDVKSHEYGAIRRRYTPIRRRHGAVWIDTDGKTSLSTNAGTSSGSISGLRVADGRWHHVAAVWQQSGGFQIAFSLKIWNLDYVKMLKFPVTHLTMEENVVLAIAAQARVTPEDVWVEFTKSELRVGMAVNASFIVNSPTLELAKATKNMLSAPNTLKPAIEAGISVEVMKIVAMELSITETLNGYIYMSTEDFVMPQINSAGTAQLYIDGFPGKGEIVYAPEGENIGMDGELLFGGGMLGQAVNTELSRIRLWSRALTKDQLMAVSGCELPQLDALLGGSWPYGLAGSWTLNSDLSNSAGTDFMPLEDVNYSSYVPGTGELGTPEPPEPAPTPAPIWDGTVTHASAGSFIPSTRCGATRCPKQSPQGCLLNPGRAVPFNTLEECERFNKMNFCRTSGSQRGKWVTADADGCHAGAGQSAWIDEATISRAT